VAQRPLPAFVAPGLAVPLRGAAARWSVSAALRAAGLRGESGFDPGARSPSAALGIAQFMPGTVRVYGRDDAFDSDGATDGQARLVRDVCLWRRGLALSPRASPGRIASAAGCVYPASRDSGLSPTSLVWSTPARRPAICPFASWS